MHFHRLVLDLFPFHHELILVALQVLPVVPNLILLLICLLQLPGYFQLHRRYFPARAFELAVLGRELRPLSFC
jgi:hypothetical protein